MKKAHGRSSIRDEEASLSSLDHFVSRAGEWAPAPDVLNQTLRGLVPGR